MSDFGETWSLVRGRFDKEIAGLSTEQLNWRLQPGALTIGEMGLHVAGVEVSFCSQLLGQELEGLDARVKQAATEGVVNDNTFPFSSDEVTPELVYDVLARARSLVEPMVNNPDPYRERTIKSALGPIIDGTGAFARLSYHPGYHQAQVHLVKTAAGFPK
jgi:hypothetical protein